MGEVAKYRNGKAHENDISEQGKYIVVNPKFVSTDGEVKKYSNKQIEPFGISTCIAHYTNTFCPPCKFSKTT